MLYYHHEPPQLLVRPFGQRDDCATVPTITILGPEMPDIAFSPGNTCTTTADLPCKKDGPVGSGRVTDINPVLLHDQDRTRPLSKFTSCYFTLASALDPPAPDSDWGRGRGRQSLWLLAPGQQCLPPRGRIPVRKQAVAAREAVDETLAACLPRLRLFNETNFVLLPAPPSSTASPADTAVPRTPLRAATPAASEPPGDVPDIAITGSKRSDRALNDVGRRSARVS